MEFRLDDVISKKIRDDPQRVRTPDSWSDRPRPASNQSCSSLIAQLSSDIINNTVSSASPASSLGSPSSSSRTNSPFVNTKFGAGFPVPGGGQDAPVERGDASDVDSSHLDDQSSCSYSRNIYEYNRMDIFTSAHNEMLESIQYAPNPLMDNNNSTPEGRGKCGDSCSFAPAPLPLDLTSMTVAEILKIIRIPSVIDSESEGVIGEYLDPHEIGHLNHLTKCFTDSLFTVALPDAVTKKENLCPVDILHTYSCCVLRLYILFKNLDTKLFSSSDQSILFQSSVLKALVCFSFLVYSGEKESWKIPSSVSEALPVTVKMTDLNQLMPRSVLQETIAINELSAKLKFDLWMCLLCCIAFFYSSYEVPLQEEDRVTALRDRYMDILLKYLKYKHGADNANVIFPEILKLLDVIMKYCNEVENQNLTLKHEEIAELDKLIESPVIVDNKTNVNLSDSLYMGVSFSKIHKRIAASVNLTESSSDQLSPCVGEDIVTPSPCPPLAPIEPSDSKNKREIEQIIIRKLLLSQQLKNNDDVGQRQFKEESSSSWPLAVAPTLPTNQNSGMNVLAIQRLLLDLSRREQAPQSPDPPLNEPTHHPFNDLTEIQMQSLHQKISEIHQRATLRARMTHADHFAVSFIDSKAPSNEPTEPTPMAIDLTSIKTRRKSSPLPDPPPSSSVNDEEEPFEPKFQTDNVDCGTTDPELQEKHVELLLDFLGQSRTSDSS